MYSSDSGLFVACANCQMSEMARNWDTTDDVGCRWMCKWFSFLKILAVSIYSFASLGSAQAQSKNWNRKGHKDCEGMLIYRVWLRS